MKKIILLFAFLIYYLTFNIEHCLCQWQPDVRLTNDTAASFTTYSNARCIATNGNIVHGVWKDHRDGNSEIYYKHSTDGGSSWGLDIRLTNNPFQSENPSVAVSGSLVHIVWFDNRNVNWQIYYKSSTDGGLNWGAETRLTINSTHSRYPSVAVSGSIVHVAWDDNRDGNWEIYYKRSTDGGLSWGTDTRLTNNSAYSGSPSIAVSSQVVHIVWYDDRDGNNEIYYKRSNDGGINWGTDIRLTNNSANQQDPSISVSGLVVHIVWNDNRNGNYDIYYKRSSDAGLSWGNDTRLTYVSSNEFVPVLAVLGSVVHIVWQDYRDFGNGEIYYKRSKDNGLTWENDTRLNIDPAISTYPSIALSGTAIHVFWVDRRDGNDEIYYKRNPTGNNDLIARLNNVYRPNDGRTQTLNITLSDSLCTGTIDSVYWYVNDSLVGRQHSMTYPFKQGTSKVKLKIRQNPNAYDSASATVTRICWKRYTNGQILAGMSYHGNNFLYAISTGDNKVYRMDINGNFIYTMQGQGNILSACSISNDTTFYFATDQNLLYRCDSTNNIIFQISLGAPATCTPTIDSLSNRIYLGGRSGIGNGFFRAYNRQTGGSPVWYFSPNSLIIGSAVISSNRKLVVASAEGIIYGFNLNLTNPVPPNWQLSLSDSILVSPAIDSAGYFYFGSRNGKIYKIELTGTSNAGIIWQISLSSAITSSPTIDANGNIYVGTEDGKFYSLNKSGGIRWYFQTPAQIKSTATITTSQKIYFGNDAGEIYGLDTNKIVRFYYIDSSKISCAMLYQNRTLYFGNEAGRIFALYDSIDGSRGPVKPVWGTFQNNVRRTGNQHDDGPSIGIQKITNIIPVRFELFQNYPNPFNPVTNIRYNVASLKFIKLIVYDILGKEIATLVNEKLQPGTYEVTWDGSQYPSGAYFYKLTAGDFKETKRMLLIK